MNIHLDNEALAQLQAALANVSGNVLRVTQAAVKSGADSIAEQWRNYAGGGELAGV
jgi:hypothetical protein